MNIKKNIAITLITFGVYFSPTTRAATPCISLNEIEPQMIKIRVERYMSILRVNPTIAESRYVVLVDKEINSMTTLKAAEEKLNAQQLHGLSLMGCEPWQGAAFNMNLDLTLSRSAYKIFHESNSKEEIEKKLSKLLVDRLDLIPSDLRSDE